MPISHISISVKHLPSSTSLFLSCLAPLGYRYLVALDGEIGLGIDYPEFFIAQETPRNPATNVHIGFEARTRALVEKFYDAALSSGAKDFGRPSTKPIAENYYSASILDFDGNEIEVVSRECIQRRPPPRGRLSVRETRRDAPAPLRDAPGAQRDASGSQREVSQDISQQGEAKEAPREVPKRDSSPAAAKPGVPIEL